MAFGNGRQIDIDKDRKAPAEVEEKRTAGKRLDVDVPISQARWSALAWVSLVASFLTCIKAMGPVIFWCVVFIVGLANFIWFMVQANKWTDVDDNGNEYSTLTPQVIFTGALKTLFFGLVAWSAWRVSTFLTPELGLSDGVANTIAWIMATKVPAVVSLLWVVFSVFFLLHIEPAFIQELLQRSPFQEQFIWSAVGAIIEHWGKKPRPRARHVLVHSNGRTVSETTGRDVAEAEGWLQDVMESYGDADTWDMMEFLVRGQRWVDGDGSPIRYSRRKWDGLMLSSGTQVTKTQARKWAEELKKAGILEDTGSGLDLARGLSLMDALEHISIGADVPLPHSDDLREWAGEAPAPRPTQAHPTHPGEEGA